MTANLQRLAARTMRRTGAGRPQLPKFFRPKLDRTQRLDCGVIHWDLVHRFSAGTATQGDLWDWIETGYTYTQMLRLLIEDGLQVTDEAVRAVAAQLDTYPAVIERHRRTGRVGFSGPEMQTARDAAEVFDQLLANDRHGVAVRAAQWATQVMAGVRGGQALPTGALRGLVR